MADISKIKSVEGIREELRQCFKEENQRARIPISRASESRRAGMLGDWDVPASG